MEQADELLYLSFLRRASILGRKGEINLVDLMRSAEVPQSLAPGRQVKKSWGLPHPESVQRRFLAKSVGASRETDDSRQHPDHDPHADPSSFQRNKHSR